MLFSVVCFLLTSRMASNGTLKRLLKINGIQVRIEPVAKTTVAKSFLKATPKVGKAGKGSGSDLVCIAKADKGSGSGPVPCPGKLPSKAWPSKSPAVKAMSKSAAVKAIAGRQAIAGSIAGSQGRRPCRQGRFTGSARQRQ